MPLALVVHVEVAVRLLIVFTRTRAKHLHVPVVGVQIAFRRHAFLADPEVAPVGARDGPEWALPGAEAEVLGQAVEPTLFMVVDVMAALAAAAAGQQGGAGRGAGGTRAGGAHTQEWASLCV